MAKDLITFEDIMSRNPNNDRNTGIHKYRRVPLVGEHSQSYPYKFIGVNALLCKCCADPDALLNIGILVCEDLLEQCSLLAKLPTLASLWRSEQQDSPSSCIAWKVFKHSILSKSENLIKPRNRESRKGNPDKFIGVKCMVIMCPRCGKVVSWIQRAKVGGRVYLYAVHEERSGGKRRRRRCYLGPSDGYEYVSRLHNEFDSLRGLGTSPDYVHERNLQYLSDLLQWFSVCGKRETVQKAVEIIEHYLPKMLKHLKSLQNK